MSTVRDHHTPTGLLLLKKKKKNGKKASIGADMEKLEPLFIAGENVKWCSYCAKQFGSSSKSEIQQFHV